jgi:hypothetical protein
MDPTIPSNPTIRSMALVPLWHPEAQLLGVRSQIHYQAKHARLHIWNAQTERYATELLRQRGNIIGNILESWWTLTKLELNVPPTQYYLVPSPPFVFFFLQLSNPCPPKPVPLGQKCIISAPPLSPHPHRSPLTAAAPKPTRAGH